MVFASVGCDLVCGLFVLKFMYDVLLKVTIKGYLNSQRAEKR